MSEVACSACGAAIANDGGVRLTEPEVERHAAFCRLEHLVAWAERDGDWRSGALLDDDESGEGLGRCVQCGDGLSYGRVLLVRHRGPLRIGDAFCGVEHAAEWAEAGGRWRVG